MKLFKTLLLVMSFAGGAGDLLGQDKNILSTAQSLIAEGQFSQATDLLLAVG